MEEEKLDKILELLGNQNKRLYELEKFVERLDTRLRKEIENAVWTVAREKEYLAILSRQDLQKFINDLPNFYKEIEKVREDMKKWATHAACQEYFKESIIEELWKKK